MANAKKTTAKKPMTDEQRAAAAERMRKARAAKKAIEAEKANEAKMENGNASELEQVEAKDARDAIPASTDTEKESAPVKGAPLYDAEEVQRMIEAALAKQREEAKPQIIQIQNDTEKVAFRWQAPVADYNVLMVGEGGMYARITGKTGTFYVPKTELSRVMDERVRRFIDDRWLIVLSGLTDEERENLNCNYREGETLDKAAFAKMVEMGDKMLEIFPSLCKAHKEMVAQRYAEAYDEGKWPITRDLVVMLNEMSKPDYADCPDTDPRKRGLFVNIIEKMNAKDAK